MKVIGDKAGRPLLALAVAAAMSSWHLPVGAQPPDAAAQGQGGEADRADSPAASAPIDEVISIGRFRSESEVLVSERLQDAYVIDSLGADSIARLGDTTVAAALRRVPGLSLVSDKFVYIRGLGERYSATYLNGATIPSPDLTRNVLPLDIVPTAVVESLRVNKSWSPAVPANFAGGTVDIRTKGVPNDFLVNLEIGSGFNSETTGTVLTYPGGGDDGFGTDDGTRALSPAILDALDAYQGDISVQHMLSFLRRQDAGKTLADAQAVNRQLATVLNRNIGLREKDAPPDLNFKMAAGNRYQVNDLWDFGFLVGTTYDSGWRETTTEAKSYTFPEERTDTRTRSTRSVNLSGNVNLGADFTEDHEISITSLFLRNTDDETEIRDFFNENAERSDGRGFRDYRLEFEERSMRTNQVRGRHSLGEATRDALPRVTSKLAWVPADAELDWFYSKSKANTDIPNQVRINAHTRTDPVTGATLDESVAAESSASDFRFTRLDDEVEDNGWSLLLPFNLGRSKLELRGGGEHTQKARTYRQSQFTLGALSVADLGALKGPLDQVFSDENILNPDNGFTFTRTGTNNQSYIAATMTDALFGALDWTYNDRWRVAAGARWEDYRQAAVDWNPYGYSESDPQVTTDPDVLARNTFTSDEVYPAASLTYMSGFWADTFQLRLGWSKTAVRPDLREITDASYVDPITADVTKGNSGVIPADVDNFDIRAEWFFASRDSFSVTLFDKNIDRPIEFFEIPASDTTIAREIINAESGNVHGAEFEFLKNLDFLGGIFETMFIQGNLTLQDSELRAGPLANSPTNPVRPLAGASDTVVNLMLGFDSPNAKHTASLVFNDFSERLFTAGRRGAPDAYEQPFTSLDLTYAWYPTDALTLKAKAQNLLGENVKIERAGVPTFEEAPGTTFALSVLWRLQ